MTKPGLLQRGPGEFVLMHEVHFIRPNLDLVRLPLIVLDNDVVLAPTTDGGSKPWAVQWLVGGALDEGAIAYITHDGLYRFRHVWTSGRKRMIDREEADKILLEGLVALGMDATKRTLIYEGVRLGGAAVWDARPACDIDRLTLANCLPDFAPLTMFAVPSFNERVNALSSKQLGYAF